jgi:hypothetical protein
MNIVHRNTLAATNGQCAKMLQCQAALPVPIWLPYLSIRPLKQFGSCNQHLVKDNLAEEINGR